MHTASSDDDDFDLDDFFDDDLEDDFDSPLSPVPEQTQQSLPALEEDGFTDSDNFYVGGASIDEDDPSVYFNEIPKEIKATRMPGIDEKYPALALIGVVVLAVANVAALGFLIFNLTGG